MSAAHEAWNTACLWQQQSAQLQGPDRDRALANAAWWFERARQIAATPVSPAPAQPAPVLPALGPPNRTVPVPVHAPGYVAPAYAVPVPAPGYGAHTPGYVPASAPGSPYGAMAYPAPPSPPTRRGLGAGAMAVVIIAAVLVVIGIPVGVVTIIRSTANAGMTADVGIEAPPDFDAAGDYGALQERWRAGLEASTLPDPMPSVAQPVPFSTDYPDPQGWLDAIGVDGVEVVVTDDVTYNCGYEQRQEEADSDRDQGFGGCYSPEYPRIIFVYWTEHTTVAQRQFLVAHEYSHLLQWWNGFDLMASSLQEDGGEDDWETAVESDATCRVLSWGGYDDAVAESSSAPCTAPDWSEGWLDQQAESQGIEIDPL